MTTPVCTHVGEAFESMWDPMIQFLLLGICLGVGLADTFGHDLGVAFLMTGILAIRTLHASGVLQEIPAEGASHDVIELLGDELVSVHLMYLFLSLTNSALAVESGVEPIPVLHLLGCASSVVNRR